MKKQTKGILITLIAGACFGAASPIAKAVYQYDVTVSCVLAWRFVIATLLLWGYLLLFRRDLNLRIRKDQILLMVFTGGIAHFLTTQCYFSGLQYVPISIQIMIYYTYPFMVNILSVLFFHERMSKLQALALVGAFVGIILTLSLDDLRMNFIGIGLCFGAAVCNTAYLLCLGKKSVMSMDSLVVVAYTSTFACISFLILSLTKGELKVALPLPCWAGIIGLAVFTTVVGALALSTGVKMIGSAKAAIISVFEPIEAIILGVLLFHERISVKGVVGIILVIMAIVVMNYVHMEEAEEMEKILEGRENQIQS